VRNIASNT